MNVYTLSRVTIHALVRASRLSHLAEFCDARLKTSAHRPVFTRIQAPTVRDRPQSTGLPSQGQGCQVQG